MGQMDQVERRVRQALGSALITRDPIAHRDTLEAAAKKVVEDFLAIAEKQGLKRGLAARDQVPFVQIGSLAIWLVDRWRRESLSAAARLERTG